MRGVRIVFVLLAVLLVATPALAHVPTFPEDNTAPERAVHVHDSVKSWSFYDRLDGDQEKYYLLDVEDGQELYVGTFTPTDDRTTPSMVLMSPTIDGREGIPEQVTVPDGWGATVIEGERPERARYEIFGPGATYHTADIDRADAAGGQYMVAVYDDRDRSGPVGVTVGTAESFSAEEYVLVAFDRVRTHLWSGQHPLFVFGPLVGTVLVGAELLRRRLRRGTVVRSFLAGAALLILSTGVYTFVQTILALSKTGPTAGALVTGVFVVVPVTCGGWVLRVLLRDGPLTARRTRVGFALAGVLSLVTWAGFVVGPAILVVVSLLPSRLFGVTPGLQSSTN